MIKHWFESGWTHHTWKSTEDSWGNPVEDWSTGVPVMGRFNSLEGAGSDRRVSADKLTEFIDAKFYCAHGTNIGAGDQLRKGGESYEVTFVRNPMDMDRFLQVEMRKL